AHGERLEGGERRSLPERWEHAEIEGRQGCRDVAAKTGEEESIAQAEPCRERLEIGKQRPFANQHEPRVRPFAEDLRCRFDEKTIALRFVEPGNRADRERVRSNPELVARLRDLICAADPPKLIEGRAE